MNLSPKNQQRIKKQTIEKKALFFADSFYLMFE